MSNTTIPNPRPSRTVCSFRAIALLCECETPESGPLTHFLPSRQSLNLELERDTSALSPLPSPHLITATMREIDLSCSTKSWVHWYDTNYIRIRPCTSAAHFLRYGIGFLSTDCCVYKSSLFIRSLTSGNEVKGKGGDLRSASNTLDWRLGLFSYYSCSWKYFFLNNFILGGGSYARKRKATVEWTNRERVV